MGVAEVIPPGEVPGISVDQPEFDLEAYAVAFERFLCERFKRFIYPDTFLRRRPVTAELCHGKQHTTDSVVYERVVPLPDGIFRIRPGAIHYDVIAATIAFFRLVEFAEIAEHISDLDMRKRQIALPARIHLIFYG